VVEVDVVVVLTVEDVLDDVLVLVVVIVTQSLGALVRHPPGLSPVSRSVLHWS
jgi:hypothetical protein